MGTPNRELQGVGIQSVSALGFRVWLISVMKRVGINCAYVHVVELMNFLRQTLNAKPETHS